jgi:hypothetical protein
MAQENIRHSFLYRICFFFALLELLSLLAFIVYIGNENYPSYVILFFLLLLVLWVYNLYVLWKPGLAAVKFFLVIKVLYFTGGLIYCLAEGFEPLVLTIHLLLLQYLMARAFYKLLLNFPDEFDT